VYVCVREGERTREVGMRVCAMIAREQESKRESVCVCVRECVREIMCVLVCTREEVSVCARDPERASVRVRERENKKACVY